MKTQGRFLLATIAVTISIFHLFADQLTAQQTSDKSVYLVLPLTDLDLQGETDTAFLQNRNGLSFYPNSKFACATMEHTGDIFLQLERQRDIRERRSDGESKLASEEPVQLAIRLDKASEVEGTLLLPTGLNGPLQIFHFSVKADQFKSTQDEFLSVKHAHYKRLWQAELDGAAWFRWQANQLAKRLGKSSEPAEVGRDRWQSEADWERTLSFANGGLALSENLQLDRLLDIAAGEDTTTFDVEDVAGITVQEFDWQSLVKDLDPQLDTLASFVPADQHALFVPSFDALVVLIETGFEAAGPMFPLISDSSASANTRQRYQDQLGLPLGRIQKLFGPQLIHSIAVTGGDPYFRTGTDVAVLFESNDPTVLNTTLQNATRISSNRQPGVEEVSGKVGEISFTGFKTDDRKICSYIATIENMVIVTNSLHQLEQIAAVSTKEVPALADLDEFRFFRDRYKLGDELETALLVISDATIRRWCSPRWRIATSRRTRSAAILSDLHAGHMSQLTSGIKTPIAVEVGPSAFSLNRFTLLDHAAISPAMGTLAFQTPIGEMDIQQISGREKQAYESWREGYQSNWSTAFDPIAIRMSLQEGKLAADLTVLPLIDNSEYESMIDVSAGAQLDPQRNSPHDRALLWFGLALNKESPTLKQFGSMGSTFAGSNFMDWLGDAVIIYVDEDPFWIDLQELEINDDRQTTLNDFFEKNLHRLPVALQFNVASSFRLTAFLVGLRAFIEQSAPDMTSWETLRHLEQAYVKVSPAPSSRREILGDFDDQIALYYLATSDTLIFSLSESVIQNAIQKAADADSQEKTNTVDPSGTMLGRNVAFQIKRSLALGASAFFADDYQQRMQSQSWAALPILNEWKRMFPDRDPVEVDRLVWSRELTCPGGGKYQWNALAKTMESSIYGHPAEPKQGPDLSQLFGQWNSGDFGLTFENQGLRARLELNQ